jgi:hypothetical protein
MKNLTSHNGKLEILKRLPNSRNGNPRYLLRVDGWTCRTPVDSSLAYGVTNFNGKNVKATIGSFRGVAMLDSVEAC